MEKSHREYHSVIEYSEQLRQGDVLRISSDMNDHSIVDWLTILTADCDIAHEKTEGILTCVPIMRANKYFDHVKMPRFQKTEAQRLQKDLCEMVYSIDKKRDPNVQKISEESLLEWISEAGSEKFALELGLDRREKAKVVGLANRCLALSSLSISHLENPLSEIFTLLEKKPQAISKMLHSWLTSEMPMDYFFVPTLPNENGIGYIVHLRAVTTIKLDDVALHSKLPSTYVAEPDRPYVRIGSFVDHLRFSIAQRAMLLFSRIGLTSSFEADAKTAIDMIVEDYIQ